MDRKHKRRRRIAFSCITGAVFLLLLSVVDHIAGLLIQLPSRSLLFPAGSLVSHRSAEFNVTVAISDAGIRDDNYLAGAPDKSTFRIVTVGDSFTFGWGVPGDCSWPNVLEQSLNSPRDDKLPHQKIEVLNFGYPGASPSGYADSAMLAIKHFRPNLLIVGTLQGDDLIQLHDQPAPGTPVTTLVADALFPTTRQWLELRKERDPITPYHQTFALTQQHIRSEFTPEQAERYRALPPRVRSSFEAGLLNPSLVQTAISTPDYFMQPVNANAEWNSVVSDRLTDSLETISRSCQAHGCQLLIAIVPNGPYVSRAALEGARDIGFTASPELLSTNAPDEMVHDVCRAAGIDCFDRTQFFRRLTPGCYFSLDGHFNEEGHRQFADSIKSVIEERVRR